MSGRIQQAVMALNPLAYLAEKAMAQRFTSLIPEILLSIQPKRCLTVAFLHLTPPIPPPDLQPCFNTFRGGGIVLVFHRSIRNANRERRAS